VHPRQRLVTALVAFAFLYVPRPSSACVGTDCLEIFSTADGGGALTISWDFAHRKVQTFGVCIAGDCLYSAVDPGFMTPPPPPPDGFFSLADATDVSLEIVAIDPAITVKVNGAPLAAVGDQALLGTAPTLHNHPSWQLRVPQGVHGEYPLSFKLTTGSPTYAESAVFSLVLTNLPTPTPAAPSPTATPTATPTRPRPACPGDCNGDGVVTINELISAVGGALGTSTACMQACDLNGDGVIEINELIAAVNTALQGCAATPTPTATPEPSYQTIASTIFAPRCALPTCHDAASNAGSLILEPGQAYDQLVGVAPSVDTAREAGLLRVDPGHPENSFLLVKLEGPPPDQGSRMPLTGSPLSDAEIALIRDWIAGGAPR
jgi:hypothetical protein